MSAERAAEVFLNTYREQNRASALLALSVLVTEFFEEYKTIGDVTDGANFILTALMMVAHNHSANKCVTDG